MGEIPFKVGVMIQPRKASQHFVSALLIMSPLSAAQMGGYAKSITHSKSEWMWISTLPIRWLVSKYSFKVFNICSHFQWASERLATRAAFEKAPGSPLFPPYFYHKSPGCVGLEAVWANNGTRQSTFCFVGESLVLGNANFQRWGTSLLVYLQLLLITDEHQV